MRRATVRLRFTLLLALAACAGLTAPAQAQLGPVDQVLRPQPAQPPASRPAESLLNRDRGSIRRVDDAIDGRYIVALDEPNGRSLTSIARIASTLTRLYGGRADYIYNTAFVGFAAKMSRLQAERLAADDRVRFVEQDSKVKLVASQRNPPWGLDRIDQAALPLNQGFDPGADGDGVHVYVIDTGIRRDHEDFGGRIGEGFSSIDETGQPTGNILSAILDGLTGNDGGEQGDDPTQDCNGHGTHVAGTVGGRQYGVAKGVMLHPVRVLGCDGSGSASGVIAGIDWVTKNHVHPAVANLSLGSGASRSVDEAVERAVRAKVVVVAAAGNEDQDACDVSPARVKEALTVGATDKNDARASFSNWGRCLDLFAPGKDIASAWFEGPRSTKTISGTSMAAPHVAGAAALILQAEPELKPEQVADKLLKATVKDKVSGEKSGSPDRLLQVK